MKVKFSKKTTELLKKAVSKRPKIKLTIGIFKDGETIYKLFDTNGEIPYVSHKYETGSIGKVFTTSLLAKYVEEGKMDLNDSVAKYMPELDERKYYPTLKRLATHTAGYPLRYPMSRGEMFTVVFKQLTAQPIKAEIYLQSDYEKLIRLTKEANLQDKDYKWAYSNFGMGLLGYAISCAAGKNYWDLMSDYMRDDLGLKNSVMGTNMPGILPGYDAKNRNVGNWSLGKEDYITPAGNITSNAEDMLEFAKLNIEENPSHLKLCHTLYDLKSKHSNMGLGWWIDYKNPNIYYHGGNTDGFASMLAFDKKKRVAVTILTNTRFYLEREKLFMEILAGL